MSTPNDTTEDLSPKTPAQVLESFYNTHSIDNVKVALWAALQGYALNENKGFLKLDVGEEQITELFDSLIALICAVDTLIEEGKIEGLKG